jgi:hypothetical protein
MNRIKGRGGKAKETEGIQNRRGEEKQNEDGITK